MPFFFLFVYGMVDFGIWNCCFECHQAMLFPPLAIESLAVAVKLGDLMEVPDDARQLKLV